MRSVLSYGGGLDSFAMLVEGLRRGDRPDVVTFVNVGDPEGKDPGEWPGTYQHLTDVVRPLCAREGIELVVVSSDRYPVRDARSLFAWLEARKQIPVAGPNRVCTVVAKVERFEAWLTDRFPAEEVAVWVGFEAGEEKRAANDPNSGTGRKHKFGDAVRRNRFPLIEWGLCRCRCEALVRASGYPVPRKSACMYCPYGSKGDWQTLARERPDVFARVVELEAAKPPTKKNNVKLSIMGFRTIRNEDGSIRERKAPPLPEFIKGTYRRKSVPCGVCGAAVKATKATGCDYLDDGESAVAEAV